MFNLLLSDLKNKQTKKKQILREFYKHNFVMELIICWYFPCSTGQPTWLNDIIPDDKVWLKVGDHKNGGSFKFCYQMADVHHPNKRETQQLLPSLMGMICMIISPGPCPLYLYKSKNCKTPHT